MTTPEFKNIAEVLTWVSKMSRKDLEEALVDMAARLTFNEDGKYDPEGSVAADSGADFVEAVQLTFHRIKINI
jgi:hypothetical protein